MTSGAIQNGVPMTVFLLAMVSCRMGGGGGGGGGEEGGSNYSNEISQHPGGVVG